MARSSHPPLSSSLIALNQVHLEEVGVQSVVVRCPDQQNHRHLSDYGESILFHSSRSAESRCHSQGKGPGGTMDEAVADTNN